MSRGFVKESDQEETPFVTPRAHLPSGVVNYVTKNGLEELKIERSELIEEQKGLIEDSKEKNRVQINFITSKLSLLEDRINTSRVFDDSALSQDKIHFGAIVHVLEPVKNIKSKYQIVGVDEADISLNKISFLSPIAKVLANKKVDDVITLKIPNGERILKIEAIDY
jgi:transcription elongation factor GreB